MVNRHFNPDTPLIMHVDINSCFATIEQQSRPRLRGRPIAIVNRATTHTGIITASYEAKAHGVGVGMKLKDAQKLIPNLIAIESDPAKYRYVYRKFVEILQSYSPHVTMKSIDEGHVDFHQATTATKARGLESIGAEIKQRLRNEIGCAMSCNIGIAPNRFLAKTAAGLHKPDGMDVITANNIRAVFAKLQLTDLTGIAARNAARLQAVGITTPLEFLDADEVALRTMVFKSIDGTKWHQRLRGWEVDDETHEIGRVGRQYVLERFDLSHDEILQRLHHLCESVGHRLRRQSLVARGVYVYARTGRYEYWHDSRLSPTPFFSNASIYDIARQLYRTAPSGVREIGIHCYKLSRSEDMRQLGLFADELTHHTHLTQATDDINTRFGERTIVAANTVNTGMYVSQKIPFGSTRYL